MQAIEVKWLPATNTKPCRLKACTNGGFTLTVSRSKYDHLDNMDLAAAIAIELARKLEWTGQLAGGGTKAGFTFCFVNPTGYEEYRA